MLRLRLPAAVRHAGKLCVNDETKTTGEDGCISQNSA